MSDVAVMNLQPATPATAASPPDSELFTSGFNLNAFQTSSSRQEVGVKLENLLKGISELEPVCFKANAT